jgi:hypothetical protein
MTLRPVASRRAHGSGLAVTTRPVADSAKVAVFDAPEDGKRESLPPGGIAPDKCFADPQSQPRFQGENAVEFIWDTSGGFDAFLEKCGTQSYRAMSSLERAEKDIDRAKDEILDRAVAESRSLLADESRKVQALEKGEKVRNMLRKAVLDKEHAYAPGGGVLASVWGDQRFVGSKFGSGRRRRAASCGRRGSTGLIRGRRSSATWSISARIRRPPSGWRRTRLRRWTGSRAATSARPR